MDKQEFDLEKVDTGSLRELGATGLYESSGFVFEDHLPKLKNNTQRIKTYREMSTDPVVGAILFSVEMHLRNAEFFVKEHEDGSKEEHIKLVEKALENLEHSFQDFMSEVTSMLIYGFALHEIVYEIDDEGRVLWKKWAPRSQDSVFQWDITDKGEIHGFYQLTKYNAQRKVYIPMEKCMHFRPSTFKSNPEGKSALRTAYRPWYFKSRLETIEAIGLERNLSGYPVLSVPIQVFSKNKKARELRNYAQDIVTRIRKDEQMGSVLPPGWELELLSSQGGNTQEIDTAINRYNLQIAQSLLSDVIMIGHSAGGGSYALSDKKYELFIVALSSWVESICEVINKQAIPKLLKLNGIDTKKNPPPRIKAKPIEQMDTLTLANAMFRLANINVIKPDDPLEEYMREFLSLPKKDPGTERHPKAEPGDPGTTSSGDSQHQAGEDRTDNVTRPTDASSNYNQSETSNLE